MGMMSLFSIVDLCCERKRTAEVLFSRWLFCLLYFYLGSVALVMRNSIISLRYNILPRFLLCVCAKH